MKPNALDKRDQADLQKYEAQIEKGQGSFIQVGQALFAIKHRKLYRQSASTFEEYCQERWGWGASRARQICGAVKFWEENKNGEPPKNEREARKQISDVKKTDDSPSNTSDEKRYQGNTLLGEPNIPKDEKPKVFLDKVGRPIPDGILELWNHAQEVGTRLRSAVSAIKCELEKGIGHDKIYAELINSVISDAEALHYSLSQIIPFAVCPTCQGKLPDRCTTCRHRGFISKFYWDGPAIGKDLRAIIQKQADKYASTSLPA